MSNFEKISLGESVAYLKPEEILGNPVVGTYLESIEQETKFGLKTNFKIETEDGIVVVNGAGNLGAKMERVNIGDTVKIEYKGKSPMKAGPHKGTGAHDFEVSVARN